MPETPPPLTQARSPVLVLGGAYSGKSELAMQLLAPDRGAVVLGTAPAQEAAFAARLADLRARRPPSWETRDTGLDLAGAVDDAAGRARTPQILIDSVSQWLAMLAVFVGGEAAGGGEAALAARLDERLAELTRVLAAYPAVRFVVVSAEVGGGAAPARPLERLYRQLVGAANIQLAAWASTVLVVHAGLPVVIK